MTLAGCRLEIIAEYPIRVNISKLFIPIPINGSLRMLPDGRHLILKT